MFHVVFDVFEHEFEIMFFIGGMEKVIKEGILESRVNLFGLKFFLIFFVNKFP